jgi:hypothetical protein
VFGDIFGGIQEFFSDLLPDGFCVPCFLKGFATGLGIGLLALAAIAAAPVEIAIALTVGLAVVGVYGMTQLAANWNHMTGEQKSEAAGNVLGGLVAGGVGPRAPPMPIPGIAMMTTPQGLVMPVLVTTAADAVVVAPAAAMAGTAAAGGGGGGSDPPPAAKPKPKAKFGETAEKHVKDRNHADDGMPPTRNPQKSRREGSDVFDSKFGKGEGGQAFTDEVLQHPDTVATPQGDGRIRYDNPDLGRVTGTGPDGTPVRGGRVVVEGNPPGPHSKTPAGEVVTQFPDGNAPMPPQE